MSCLVSQSLSQLESYSQSVSCMSFWPSISGRLVSLCEFALVNKRERKLDIYTTTVSHLLSPSSSTSCTLSLLLLLN